MSVLLDFFSAQLGSAYQGVPQKVGYILLGISSFVVKRPFSYRCEFN